MRIITREDIIDIYQKLAQRGMGFLLSKINPKGQARTKSAFSNSAIMSSNWWIIPKVRERWNEKITGDKQVDYETYFIGKYVKDQGSLKLLSIGSGICSHEIKFASFENFEKVVCIDIADNLLKKASQIAKEQGLDNMEFLSLDIWKAMFSVGEFDAILFHSSLHHFANINSLIEEKVKKWLKPGGLLLLNEYVGKNRLQYDRTQLAHINKGLELIPSRLKKRFKTNLTKKRYYGSGYLRMIVADPSECIESEMIRPVIHSQFRILEEKSFGGNLLMSILKDISHHFVDDSDIKAQEILETLFELEDTYLKDHQSDFIFGVYQNI